MTDSDILHLDPELLRIYREWMMECNSVGLSVRVTITWRSAEDQDKAKANGRSNAAAGQSPHNCVDENGNPCSKAFDFACFNDQHAYITDGQNPAYTQAGEIGEKLGLEWGGRWVHKDPDHLEMKNWKEI